MTSSTKNRCCATVATSQPSQKPSGPSGHEPGIVAHDHERGQPEEDQRPVPRPARPPVVCSTASRPMVSTRIPETWWLYSDQARSASLRGASGSSTGISDDATASGATGIRGVKRVATSASVARSWVTIHRGRQRGERGGREEHGEAEPELDLHEAAQRELVGVGRSVAGGGRRGSSARRARADRRGSPPWSATIRPYAVPTSAV